MKTMGIISNEPRKQFLRIVTEPNGRQIIGYVDFSDLRIGGVLIHEPILLMEQMLPGNRVNINIAPVFHNMIVHEMIVQATSMLEVEVDSSIDKLYAGKWEQIATAIRAAQSGIIAADATSMPKGPPTHGR
jgi:hypothetical protein